MGKWASGKWGGNAVNWFLGMLIGPPVGLAIGWLTELTPMPALAQSVTAVFVTIVSTTVVIIWLSHRLKLEGTVGVYYGIGFDDLGRVLATLLVAAALHEAMRFVAPSTGWVLDHRPLWLAAATGVYVGVWHAKTLDLLARLRREFPLDL